MTRKIITIQASKLTSQKGTIPSLKKRRVAGYARVSTDHDDQTSSYETQMNYYTQYISSRGDWEFVKMYSDEGISGTNTKKRLGFQEMMKDALDGKLDLIITKSVSRFARNTVDSLSSVRLLKEAGVEIYFEKENIWTFDSKGELLITIMSSLAQEESRSISENVTWSKRKMAADGTVHFNYTTVLGFKEGENGGFVIDEEEAKIVRYIFSLFLKGENSNSIAKILSEQQVPTPTGKKKWSYQTVKSILQNEKYKGDALLQKSFTVDYLTKQKKKNEGELPQYYVENNHQAIIDKATFDLVQLELAQKGRRTKTSYFGKVICGCCGHPYGRQVWHSTSKYRKYVYRCIKKYSGEICDTPHVIDREIQDWVIQAINQIVTNRGEIIHHLRLLIQTLDDTSTLEEELNALDSQLSTIQKEVEQVVSENAKVAQDQQSYQERYHTLVASYQATEEAYVNKMNQLQERRHQQKQLNAFVEVIEQQDKLLTEFDETLFCTLVDQVVVDHNKRVDIHFKNGQVISQ